MKEPLILIKGAGDLASGVAHRLHRAGWVPVMTELAQPLVVRRTVSFAEAVYEGRVAVEGVTAALAENERDIAILRRQGIIPVTVDPAGTLVKAMRPAVLVDASMAKKNQGTRIKDAKFVIALGPGYCAGRDVHAVVETKRGHYLGRVIVDGFALADTGEPDPVNGYSHERLLRAPAGGVFRSGRRIGDTVAAGEIVGWVREAGDDQAPPPEIPVRTAISGVLRGLIRDGCRVKTALKIGDVDPRGNPEYCSAISDKARAVAGGVLEALLMLSEGDIKCSFFVESAR
ncbi:selenium-dependent molybdenum cofactor biosynthesis protein YqeB [Anaeroselena agilis]|uniref:Selenium-dependent molybdenum cofactor biosynthesis protein YqeB n=1 Tax=Anaeroselena agilis TaxID=3063788 RepID=A0ABU3P1P2_9FIRM|nr:selenium-dependent molybdenum cofactor biosynthesis protein YqeB [Selenomonadales bacterium 4137-cl]